MIIGNPGGRSKYILEAEYMEIIIVQKKKKGKKYFYTFYTFKFMKIGTIWPAKKREKRILKLMFEITDFAFPKNICSFRAKPSPSVFSPDMNIRNQPNCWVATVKRRFVNGF